LFRNANRRADVRVSARVAVKFQAIAQAARALNTFSINFSAGGLCIRTRRPHAVGDRIALSLNIDGEHFDLKGTVAWARGDVLGIRFEDVPPKDRERLELVSKALAKTHPPAP
jgi:uncharacterized protein (TIGR02266 family)